jgi:uncharacterized protein (DUF1778 family)
MPRTSAKRKENRTRAERLGFRIDEKTRDLIARAAELEQRSLTDFCLTALADAAEQAIHRHEVLSLSERDREIFFDTLMNPPEPHERLRRAAAAARARIAP